MVEVAVRTALRFLADLRLLRLRAHLESPIEALGTTSALNPEASNRGV